MAMKLLRRGSAALLLVGVFSGLMACAQSSGAGRAPESGRIQAKSPGAGYVYVAGAESTDPNHDKIYINPDLMTDASGGDGKVTALFGIYFMGAVRDAKSAPLGVTGDGSGVDRPIVFNPPVAAQQELDMTMNELAHRHPDRRDVKGSLYRSPSGAYLLYAEFQTAAGSNALYYDVSRWAAYQNEKAY